MNTFIRRHAVFFAFLFTVIAVVVALFLAKIFLWDSPSTEDEIIPEIISLTNTPELHGYMTEFSGRHRENVVAMSDRPEPKIPLDHSLIQGRIIFADHNTNHLVWAIQSYLGKDWLDGQRFYIYSDATKKLEEVAAFNEKTIFEPVILSASNQTDFFVLVPVWTKDRDGYYSDWAHELWAYQPQSKEAKRVTIGAWVNVSPDRSKVAFWRSARNNFLQISSGFHCLYLWDVETGKIEPIISMWESDPGSGMSWDLRWSDDSQAMSITGSCGGFSRGRLGQNKELNLIYSVKGKKFYSVN